MQTHSKAKIKAIDLILADSLLSGDDRDQLNELKLSFAPQPIASIDENTPLIEKKIKIDEKQSINRLRDDLLARLQQAELDNEIDMQYEILYILLILARVWPRNKMSPQNTPLCPVITDNAIENPDERIETAFGHQHHTIVLSAWLREHNHYPPDNTDPFNALELVYLRSRLQVEQKNQPVNIQPQFSYTEITASIGVGIGATIGVILATVICIASATATSATSDALVPLMVIFGTGLGLVVGGIGCLIGLCLDGCASIYEYWRQQAEHKENVAKTLKANQFQQKINCALSQTTFQSDISNNASHHVSSDNKSSLSSSSVVAVGLNATPAAPPSMQPIKVDSKAESDRRFEAYQQRTAANAVNSTAPIVPSSTPAHRVNSF